MKLNPKIILGVSVCTLLILISSIFIYTKIVSGNKNWFYLDTVNNKFKINFQISQKNQANFESVLKSLNLPPNTQNGIEFKLDATSSAQLSFLSPIRSTLKFSSKSISFEGKLSHNQSINEKTPQSIKVPNSTVFAIFAPDLSTFLENKYQFTPDQKNWLSQNLVSSNGQYLAIFAPHDFAIYFENDKINLEELNNISSEASSESIPNENLPNNKKTYLLKIDTKENKEPTSIILFQTGKWNILTTTNEAAKAIESAQNVQGLNFDFERASANNQTSFILLFKNNDNNPSKEILSSLININGTNNLNEAKLLDVLYNISQASFVLKQDHFSGLIKFK